MNRTVRNTSFAAAVTAILAAGFVAAPMDVAEAKHKHHHYGSAAAAGVIGLATGAIIAGAMSQPRTVTVYEEPVYYGGRPRPWTPSWYAYCSERYRSFDPRTGTFRGYDGRNHFCR